jgi:molybdenum cofactor biosynthesis enzyme MoaA
LIIKNRDRGEYTFANINLLGKCNANCYFCLGKDIQEELAGKHQLGVPFKEWLNFDAFLETCKSKGITKLYLTGQTADGLQYDYLSELVSNLQADGFEVGVRTNGYLAVQKMQDIQAMNGEIGYSIHSLVPETNKKIMGRRDIPDWGNIIPASGDNVRVSIVLNRYNVSEVFDLIEYVSKFPNVRYVQVRRISTDTRYELLREDVELYEKFYSEQIASSFPLTRLFYGAECYSIFGKEVTFWRTVETSANSLNYFTDGTISDEYFIVEGYLREHK